MPLRDLCLNIIAIESGWNFYASLKWYISSEQFIGTVLLGNVRYFEFQYSLKVAKQCMQQESESSFEGMEACAQTIESSEYCLFTFLK